MAGQVRDKNSSFDDDTYKIAYAERKNYFSLRLHYSGELIGNPDFSYEVARLKYLITVMLTPLNWVQLTRGHLGSVFVMNVTEFVVFTKNVKFIDVYFIKAGNTDLLIEIEDEYGNIKLSDWSTKILKAKENERDRLNVERVENEEKVENKENDKNEENEWSDSDSEYEAEEEDEDEEDDLDESEYDDVLYRKEKDNFDDGDLDGSNSILSEVFLDQIEEEFRKETAGWVPTTEDDGKDGLDKNLDDSNFDSDNTTSDSEPEMSQMNTKVTEQRRKKNRYVYFNESESSSPAVK
ncbi:hypothetical protein LIER_29958 [Lithospermum erythrorhizon]|uniref:Uncharacterized protein n=1 Tax=Lithospermum erythrorhizon TaxID=34254 RepID=A0AAV3RKZ3_LITER